MTETTDETEARRRARRALLEIGARWAEAKRRGHAASLSGGSPAGGRKSAADTAPSVAAMRRATKASEGC